MLSAANPIDNFIHKTAQPSPGRSTSSCARFSRPGWTCRPAGRPGRPWTWRYRFLSRPGKRFRATRWQVCVSVYLIGLKSNRIKHLDGKTLTGMRGGVSEAGGGSSGKAIINECLRQCTCTWRYRQSKVGRRHSRLGKVFVTLLVIMLSEIRWFISGAVWWCNIWN